MSDYLAAEIKIGGPLASRLVKPFCSVVAAAGAALDWGDAPFHPRTAEELLEGRRDQDGALVLSLYDDDALWGRFEALEDWLVAHGVPFDRRHEAKYEYDAELVRYRPGAKPNIVITAADGEPVLGSRIVARMRQRLKAAIAAIEKRDQAAALRAARAAERILVSALPDVPPLGDFEIREEP